jgi:1,4-alpha-glucan branching enzyme
MDVQALGGVTEARVDPDHHFLLRRHWGDTARFALRAPNAKTVELTGNFLSTPVAATRTGDLWTVALPLPEGRYVWLWRVVGASPADDVALADARRPAGDLDARAGVIVVRPLQHFPERRRPIANPRLTSNPSDHGRHHLSSIDS